MPAHPFIDVWKYSHGAERTVCTYASAALRIPGAVVDATFDKHGLDAQHISNENWNLVAHLMEATYNAAEKVGFKEGYRQGREDAEREMNTKMLQVGLTETIARLVKKEFEKHRHSAWLAERASYRKVDQAG